MRSSTTQRAYVVGDVHGELDGMMRLLRDAGLVSAGGSWAGADAEVWFTGDFTDRGPDGIGVLDAVMRLQREAEDAGGCVRSVLGNHDAMLVAAHRFGTERGFGLRVSFAELWAMNGGQPDDLRRLEDRHVLWITELPALAVVAGHLIVHADATFYVHYGWSVDEVNEAVRRVIAGGNTLEWGRLVDAFAERHAFERDPEAARRLLKVFGGDRIVHGHTPIPFVAGIDPEQATNPLVYADGLVVNVDGGMYAGGPGILHELRADA